MPKAPPPTVKKPDQIAPEARQILRNAIKVSLATNDRKKPWPFLSLTSVATLIDNTPILLLSNIAHHTRNIAVDPQVSLLFDQTPIEGSPLEYGRITLHGVIEKNNSFETEQRFMARHPQALYAQFSDFDFYTLDLKAAHYVAGFGSTTTLAPSHLLLKEDGSALQQAERDIISHMNNQHKEAVHNMAQSTLSEPFTAKTQWIMTGLDYEGCDFQSGSKRQRLLFPEQIATLEEARIMLKTMAER